MGALASGIISQLAPETRGGGGDAMIDAFHRHDGVIRKRVAWVKALASIFTLGTGGAGGREGPTMQIGGALGSRCGRLLRVSRRRAAHPDGRRASRPASRRCSARRSGAALLAVEVLYRDDFESDALIPAVLASVVAYSVVISIFGESTLFASPGHFPFVIKHLWLYGLLALLVSVLAALFLSSLRTVQRVTASLPIPRLGAPGAGRPGGRRVLRADHRVRRLARGAAGPGPGPAGRRLRRRADRDQRRQLAAHRLGGRRRCCSFLCLAKIVASSLTIGSGGSAGDFAPSLVIGGLFGGAFGRAAQLLLGDPRIDPGAFALVAMGTFYGGIAHVAAVVAGPRLRAGGKLRPARAADAGRGDRVRRAAPQVALPRAAGVRSATPPSTSSARRSTCYARPASAP